MKTFLFLMLSVLTAVAADVKISDLPAATNPSTNSWAIISDMNAVTKSQKYLITNWVLQAELANYLPVSSFTYGAITNLLLFPGENTKFIDGNSDWRVLTLADISDFNEDGITNALGMNLVGLFDAKLSLSGGTVSGDLNVTGTFTSGTHETDSLVVTDLAETNKLAGIGYGKTVVVATKAMATNTLEVFNGVATDYLGGDAAMHNLPKQTKYMLLMRPDWGDGVGAVPQTNNYAASGLMHWTFSGNAETNVNYVVYETVVPPDLDTSVPMTATFGFKSGGTDTDTVTWHIAYGLGVSGSNYPDAFAEIAASPLAFEAVTPTTPAALDYQTTAALTLTDWAAAMTPGTPLLISIRRLQDSNDDAQTDVFLRIAYGSTQ